MNIAGITHVVLDPYKERSDLSQVILRRDAVVKENVDRCLSDAKILRPLFDQTHDVSNSLLGASIPFRDLPQRNPRLAARWADVHRLVIPTNCPRMTSESREHEVCRGGFQAGMVWGSLY